MKTLLRSFYDLGHIANSKSYYLYSRKLKKHDYYFNFFLNYNYCCITQNLNLAYKNQFDIEKLKEEYKLNSFYFDKNIGLFVYPNICMKHIYTIHKAKTLKKEQNKILKNVMSEHYEKLVNEFNSDYLKSN